MADKIFTIDELKKFDGKEGKKAYNMEIKGNDCFIDMKFTVVTGSKI